MSTLKHGLIAAWLGSKVAMVAAGGWWLALAVVLTLLSVPLLLSRITTHPWEKPRARQR